MAYKVKHIHCPANGWDCPYYTDEGHPCRCTIGDPMADCDDFGYFYDEGDDYYDDDWEVEEQLSHTKQLIKTLKEKGCEMGYSGSTWYSLAEIEKIAKEIEERGK